MGVPGVIVVCTWACLCDWCSCGSVVEHCVSNAKVVCSIPRDCDCGVYMSMSGVIGGVSV